MNKINKEMRESFGKRVRITCVDGEVLEGECKYFTPALDNEDGRESIVVISGGNIEVFENEIAFKRVDEPIEEARAREMAACEESIRYLREELKLGLRGR